MRSIFNWYNFNEANKLKEIEIPESFKKYYITSTQNPGIKIPDPILRSKSSEISNESYEELLKISNDLYRHLSYGFLGIAAPQIGYDKRMIVVGAKGFAPEIMVNPKILDRSGEIYSEEGCMSVPGLYGMVKRFQKTQVQASDIDGQDHIYDLEGLPSIICQHECGHLDGELFYDIADPATLKWRHIELWKSLR